MGENRGRVGTSSDAAPEDGGRRLRILVVIRGLGTGGTELHLATVLPRLRDPATEITLFVMQAGHPMAQVIRARAVRVVEGSHSPFAAVRVPSAALRLACLLRRERFDVIHFFLPESYLVGGLISLVSPPIVRVMSRRSLARYQETHPLLAVVERRLHRRMDFVLGNSQAVVEDLLREGVARQRLGMIRGGVDLDRIDRRPGREAARAQLGIPEQAFVVTVIANLIPYKGHADLLAAVARAGAVSPTEWRVLCAGRDDGHGARLREQARALGLESQVCWLGLRDDVPVLLAAADVAVSCSHEEGFSNSVLEAMAAGLALVVTDVGGNAEAVVHEESGLVVPPQDPATLASALVRLREDADLRSRLGAAARRRVQAHFSLDTVIDGYRELYSALEQQRVPQRLCIDAGAG